MTQQLLSHPRQRPTHVVTMPRGPRKPAWALKLRVHERPSHREGIYQTIKCWDADCRPGAQAPRHTEKQQLKPGRQTTTGSMRRGSSAALAMDAANSAAATSTTMHAMKALRVAMLASCE